MSKTFLELAAERYSVRDFAPAEVEQEKIDKILEAAKLAPTAVNFQPQKLYVATGEALARLAAIRPLFGATLAILICYDDSISWKNARDNGHDSGDVDAAIVTTHMMMEAQELGLGSCWIGAFSPEAVRSEFGIPAGIHPVAILALGYPSESCRPSDRHAAYRSMEEMVHQL